MALYGRRVRSSRNSRLVESPPTVRTPISGQINVTPGLPTTKPLLSNILAAMLALGVNSHTIQQRLLLETTISLTDFINLTSSVEVAEADQQTIHGVEQFARLTPAFFNGRGNEKQIRSRQKLIKYSKTVEKQFLLAHY